MRWTGGHAGENGQTDEPTDRAAGFVWRACVARALLRGGGERNGGAREARVGRGRNRGRRRTDECHDMEGGAKGVRDYSFWSRVWARRGPTGRGPDAGRRPTRADALSSIAGHTYDDLRQGMSEQMLEIS